ncbi:hypothetical protein DBV39_15860 [Orrella marina]|uniref:Uncharacterized protein n=1 Tax=Orrella marina TaxID=2163011 RepID=A0A2R4XMB6_9BURK|nr:hypothetical protein DBV39_15860 [Orrella marina]
MSAVIRTVALLRPPGTVAAGQVKKTTLHNRTHFISSRVKCVFLTQELQVDVSDQEISRKLA